MTRTVTPTREVKTCNILCWGMGDIFGSGAMTITGLWLLYFYIEVAGLSLLPPPPFSPSPKSGMGSPTR
ncbi:hypothetical protein LNP02_11915 [Klebsiella variicola subsp. variicola]|uniref:Oligogalacturonide transporter n=1 Tax=Klebsiella variicola TaxID=244366 RepID=A0A7H4MQ87_KLEVA|nr:hypothetical protein [Klebsiella variicola subsp. variicola]STS92487.1 oligogalacturonide transporter [Klebsiella variicola]